MDRLHRRHDPAGALDHLTRRRLLEPSAERDQPSIHAGVPYSPALHTIHAASANTIGLLRSIVMGRDGCSSPLPASGERERWRRAESSTSHVVRLERTRQRGCSHRLAPDFAVAQPGYATWFTLSRRSPSSPRYPPGSLLLPPCRHRRQWRRLSCALPCYGRRASLPASD